VYPPRWLYLPGGSAAKKGNTTLEQNTTPQASSSIHIWERLAAFVRQQVQQFIYSGFQISVWQSRNRQRPLWLCLARTQQQPTAAEPGRWNQRITNLWDVMPTKLSAEDLTSHSVMPSAESQSVCEGLGDQFVSATTSSPRWVSKHHDAIQWRPHSWHPGAEYPQFPKRSGAIAATGPVTRRGTPPPLSF
jgi:hypothetical protein